MTEAEQNKLTLPKTYSNGLPVSTGLSLDIEDQRKRIALKKASVIYISGTVGEGKTTLAVHAADLMQGEPIDLKTQYAIGGEDFQRKLGPAARMGKKVIIYDEAGDLDNQSQSSQFNQELKQIFNVFRATKICVIMCMPDYTQIDSRLIKAKTVRVLFNCYGRNESYGNYDSYELDSIERIYTTTRERKKLFAQFQSVIPNDRGHFLDLSPARSAELEKISLAGKLAVIEKRNLGKDKIAASQIASLTGFKLQTIYEKLKETGAEFETVGGINYYDNKVIWSIGPKLKQYKEAVNKAVGAV